MGFLHWIGVTLLFISSVLLLITTISAPVIDHIGLLKVQLVNGTTTQHSSVQFGTFGYCINNAASPSGGGYDSCTKSHIGYAPAHVIAAIDHTDISDIAAGTSDSLTRVMVLHPIECGLAFIAFLLACGAGIVGSLAGALVALLAWVLTLISLAIDFSLFGIIHHHVNNDGSGSRATFGVGLWCLAAAFVTLFLGMLIVFFTCCANRREKRRARAGPVEEKHAPRRRKRFGFF